MFIMMKSQDLFLLILLITIFSGIGYDHVNDEYKVVDLYTKKNANKVRIYSKILDMGLGQCIINLTFISKIRILIPL